MLERCYFKISDINSPLYIKCSEFLEMEGELRQRQKQAVEAKVPKFSKYQYEGGYNRIIQYEGFVFEDQNSIDNKVWTTKMVDGFMLSVPNRRTKAGRQMQLFLRDFRRTNEFDVLRVLGLHEKCIWGQVGATDIFKYKDCIYITMDSQYHTFFKDNNSDVIEITYGEMNKAMESIRNL